PPYHKDGDGPLYRNQPAKEYNRNQESHAIEDITRWYDYWKERPGTGKRVSAGGVNIIFSETNTHHRGAENYRRSGEVDALRIPKENFYAHQVMWDGWVDTENPGIHIIGHWNYSDATVKDIFVVSSANKVVLSVNGKTIDSGKQSHRFLFTFKNIQWQAGTIAAIGYDNNGKEICKTSKSTAGAPAVIRLTKIANPKGMKADGHDLVIVQAEVIDKNGQRCPIAMNLLNFDLKGAAEWRGGMAQGPSNYILSKSLPVECGVNRILIRSTTKAGAISISAAADGLKPASISWQSKPVVVANGLNSQLASADLSSNLDRGPTPATASFTPLRRALTIVKVNAGVYTDSAAMSYDDNEMSDWHNDGKLSTAWIEYELDQPAVINEINLKLNNFRSRSYPLKISVDGQTVFNDSTTRSLGYTLLVCRPVKGKKVRIELVAASQGDASARMTEVTGKKLDDGVARDDVNAKGTLSIIEAEIYEKIK
ncbi:MAG TPA: DUF4982 domain-containing protein, partial [Chitinophagaceae bacterium]|nr:DUF4982 domain-containing protein [Chitinophagaceae bacterium]